jgi:hypothetical protein
MACSLDVMVDLVDAEETVGRIDSHEDLFPMFDEFRGAIGRLWVSCTNEYRVQDSLHPCYNKLHVQSQRGARIRGQLTYAGNDKLPDNQGEYAIESHCKFEITKMRSEYKRGDIGWKKAGVVVGEVDMFGSPCCPSFTCLGAGLEISVSPKRFMIHSKSFLEPCSGSSSNSLSCRTSTIADMGATLA